MKTHKIIAALILYVVIFKYSTNTYANDLAPDSLLNNKISTQDKNRYEDYLKGKNFIGKNRDSAFYYLNKSISYKNAIEDSIAALSYYQIGRLYFYTEPKDFGLALKQYKMSKKIGKEIQHQQIFIDASLAESKIYGRTNFHQKSLQILLEIEDLFGSELNSKHQITIYSVIAKSYYHLKDFNKAIENARKSIDLFSKDDKNVAKEFINLGTYYLESRQMDSAQVYYQKALLIFNKTQLNVDAALNGLSRVFEEKKMYDSAAFYVYQWLDWLKSYNNQNYFYLPYYRLSEIYFKQGNDEKSFRYANSYLKAVNNDQDYSIYKKRMNEILGALHERKGNYKEALYHLKLSKIQADTITSRQEKNKLADLVSLFELEHKEKIIQEQANANTLLQVKILAIGSTSISLILIFIILINWLRKKAKLNKNKADQLAIKNNQLIQQKETIQIAKDKKSQALIAYSQENAKQKELLRKIKIDLGKIREKVSSEAEPLLIEIDKQLSQSIHQEKEWERLKVLFEDIHPRFFQNLKAKNQDISPSDQKIAALTLLGIDNKQASLILDIECDSIKIAKNRLKKKLQLKPEQDLHYELTKIIQSQTKIEL